MASLALVGALGFVMGDLLNKGGARATNMLDNVAKNSIKATSNTNNSLTVHENVERVYRQELQKHQYRRV